MKNTAVGAGQHTRLAQTPPRCMPHAHAVAGAMNKGGGKQQKHKKHFHQQQNRRSKAESDEIEAIERVLAEQAPPRGSNPLAVQQAGIEAMKQHPTK